MFSVRRGKWLEGKEAIAYDGVVRISLTGKGRPMECRKPVQQILFMGVVFSVCFSTAAGAMPNVVFVLVDTCREDAVDGARNGTPLMPYLAEFEGVRFRNAFSTASWTTPSMASIFTSTHVDTHQVHSGSESVRDGLETMAEYLHAAGYFTIGVQSNGQIMPEWGFAQGFDQYVFGDDAPASWITDSALQLLEGATGPFFLYAHYSDPHVAYEAPQGYRTQMGYPDPGLPFYERAIVEDFAPYQVDYLAYHLGMQPALVYTQLSPLGRDAARALYDAEVRFTDDELSSLLDGLLGTYPDTVVVVCADHGEHFWEHDSLGHTTTLYEQLVHVPLFIRIPGQGRGTSDAIVSTADILPTLSGILGLPWRSQWEGQDALGSVDGDRAVYASAKCRAPWLRDLEMVRTGQFKLVHEYKTGQDELYDLGADPAENYSLVAEQPDTVRELRTMLHVHLLNNARANGADAVVHATPGGFVEEGKKIQLTAPEGTGHVWFKNGVPVDGLDPRISGADGPVLVIDPVLNGDAGAYECMYSDSLLHLQVTLPHNLLVLSDEEVPIGGSGAIFLLFLAVGAGSVSVLRSPGDGNRCR